MRIAILAACAGMLVLAQADFARGNYDAACEAKGPVRSTDVGPEPTIMVAQNRIGEPIPGIDIVVCPSCSGRLNAGFGLPNKKIGNVRGTLPKGKAQRGFKISDNENPRPTDRITRKKGGNFDAGRRANRAGEAGPRTYFIGGTTGGVWHR